MRRQSAKHDAGHTQGQPDDGQGDADSAELVDTLAIGFLGGARFRPLALDDAAARSLPAAPSAAPIAARAGWPNLRG